MSTERLLEAGQLNYGTYGSKVHRGYGASRLPIPGNKGAVVAAGESYQKIAEGHLGRAAGDPNNPLSKWIAQQLYGKSEEEIVREVGETALIHQYPPLQLKPDHLKWNKETRKRYPEHWSSVRNKRPKTTTPAPPREEDTTEEPKNGIIIPFSNNIGPGNTVQEPRTAADVVAKIHDEDYQSAKKPADVRKADRQAINHFAYETVSGTNPISNVQSAIGLVGLGIKYGVETIAGKVLYGNYVFTLS